jgi:hypothetical protein
MKTGYFSAARSAVVLAMMAAQRGRRFMHSMCKRLNIEEEYEKSTSGA